jgi:hypothetical protein
MKTMRLLLGSGIAVCLCTLLGTSHAMKELDSENVCCYSLRQKCEENLKAQNEEKTFQNENKEVQIIELPKNELKNAKKAHQLFCDIFITFDKTYEKLNTIIVEKEAQKVHQDVNNGFQINEKYKKQLRKWLFSELRFSEQLKESNFLKLEDILTQATISGKGALIIPEDLKSSFDHLIKQIKSFSVKFMPNLTQCPKGGLGKRINAKEITSLLKDGPYLKRLNLMVAGDRMQWFSALFLDIQDAKENGFFELLPKSKIEDWTLPLANLRCNKEEKNNNDAPVGIKFGSSVKRLKLIFLDFGKTTPRVDFSSCKELKRLELVFIESVPSEDFLKSLNSAIKTFQITFAFKDEFFNPKETQEKMLCLSVLKNLSQLEVLELKFHALKTIGSIDFEYLKGLNIKKFGLTFSSLNPQFLPIMSHKFLSFLNGELKNLKILSLYNQRMENNDFFPLRSFENLKKIVIAPHVKAEDKKVKSLNGGCIIEDLESKEVSRISDKSQKTSSKIKVLMNEVEISLEKLQKLGRELQRVQLMVDLFAGKENSKGKEEKDLNYNAPSFYEEEEQEYVRMTPIIEGLSDSDEEDDDQEPTLTIEEKE